MLCTIELTGRQAEIFEEVMERIDETAVYLVGLSHEERLLLGDMEVHHIMPKSSGGKDNYSNLALVTEDVHKLIHATDPVIIQKYLR